MHYLAYQSFDHERTWCRLLQKRVMRTKLYIYVFIICVWMFNAILNTISVIMWLSVLLVEDVTEKADLQQSLTKPKDINLYMHRLQLTHNFRSCRDLLFELCKFNLSICIGKWCTWKFISSDVSSVYGFLYFVSNPFISLTTQFMTISRFKYLQDKILTNNQ